MHLLWIFFLNTLCALSIANSELISSLPGQTANVNFKQYSGYVVTDEYYGRAQFYYFVEALSENPLSLPLTLWLGGAHGCSTIGFSLFAENGPFLLGEDDNLIKNEFSWNLESNMLYVDSPIGTGFSYSNTSSDYDNWDDDLTAIGNMKFLLKWFEEFPRYRDVDLYFAGDSYGGHLVPQLATLVLEYNIIQLVKPIQLKGIALGNPHLDLMISSDADDFFLYHGIISEELRAFQKKRCNSSTYVLELFNGKVSKDCNKMQDKFDEEVGDEIDYDDFLMPICTSSNSVGSKQLLASRRSVADLCLSDGIEAYLNKPNVQKALHANTTHLPYPWAECKGPISNNKYRKKDRGRNIIPTLSALLRRHIPIMLYSGDQDLLIPVTQTRKIANMLARDLKLKALQKHGPWYDGVQIGGWSQSFGKSRKGKDGTHYLTFASIRGASNFVPHTSPSYALTLFKAFLKGFPPPRTNSTGS